MENAIAAARTDRYLPDLWAKSAFCILDSGLPLGIAPDRAQVDNGTIRGEDSKEYCMIFWRTCYYTRWCCPLLLKYL